MAEKRDVWRFRSIPRGIVTAIRIVSRRGEDLGEGAVGLDLVAAVEEEEAAADLIAELHCHCQKKGLLKSRVGVWRGVIQIQPTPNTERVYGFGRNRTDDDATRRRCQLGQLPVKFNLGRAESIELGDPGDRDSEDS